ncbi:hypothetical protein ACPCXF_10450 [Lysinibacillus agricola]
MSANVAAAMFYLCESATTATTLAEEAARRSPTGKRVAWNGNHLI